MYLIHQVYYCYSYPGGLTLAELVSFLFTFYIYFGAILKILLEGFLSFPYMYIHIHIYVNMCMCLHMAVTNSFKHALPSVGNIWAQ